MVGVIVSTIILAFFAGSTDAVFGICVVLVYWSGCIGGIMMEPRYRDRIHSFFIRSIWRSK